ncbi:MAG: hypothetical protein M3Z24_01405, partial [Chloroflexota bacterium]|nr:hypothetical protein [Chloroflexota bacterium]
SLVIFVSRQNERISMEAATIILIGVILSISSHVFPWYTTALLPWIAILVGPVWARWAPNGLQGKGIAVAMAWYFVSVTIFGYFFRSTVDWYLYYWFVYDIVIAGLIIASAVGFIRKRYTKAQQITLLREENTRSIYAKNESVRRNQR